MRKSWLKTSVVCILLGTSGCVGGLTLSSADNDAIQATLTKLGNTATSDINTAISVANAATPVDTDGARCGQGALTVVQAIQKVIASTAGPATVGVATKVEIASLYQPGSAQYNYVVTTLETACIAKVHDVNQATTSAAGIISAIPAVLGLAG